MPSTEDLAASAPGFDASLWRGVMEKGFARNTLVNYDSFVEKFHRFCDDNRIPQDQRLPASEPLLCAFAVSLATHVAGSSATGVFSGLKAWHMLNNTQWCGSARLQVFLRGVAALAPKSSSRDPRQPVTLDMIRMLFEELDLRDPLDVVIFAVATVAFWGLCRLGELLGTARTRYSPNELPSRRALEPAFTQAGSRELSLPRTKTSQVHGQKVILLRQAYEVDPIRALERHLATNNDIQEGEHLFAYQTVINGKQTHRNLTKEVFLNRCNAIWSKHGITRITGHCFRIGGTTELLLQGLAPDLVKSMGRWSSDAHLRYWRETRSIAAEKAELLPRNRKPISHDRTPSAHSRPSRTWSSRATFRGRPY